MKPLLIGEDNPRSDDPRYDLAPLGGGSGTRLARILGMTPREYLRAFDRLNLCRGKWDDVDALTAAANVRLGMVTRGQSAVLLGRRVCRAMGVPYRPFEVVIHVPALELKVLVLPHPSGRCRYWNDRRNWTRARRATWRLLRECGTIWRRG